MFQVGWEMMIINTSLGHQPVSKLGQHHLMGLLWFMALVWVLEVTAVEEVLVVGESLSISEQHAKRAQLQNPPIEILACLGECKLYIAFFDRTQIHFPPLFGIDRKKNNVACHSTLTGKIIGHAYFVHIVPSVPVLRDLSMAELHLGNTINLDHIQVAFSLICAEKHLKPQIEMYQWTQWQHTEGEFCHISQLHVIFLYGRL